MHRDIKLKFEDGNFKFRVCEIVEIDGKVLLCQMHGNPFFCLPGGHCEIGESTKEAVLREMQEETLIKAKINKLVLIHENIFATENGKPFHELAFYYLLSPKTKNFTAKDFTRTEFDKEGPIELKFVWLDKNDIKNTDIRPAYLKQVLLKKKYLKSNYIFEHKIGN